MSFSNRELKLIGEVQEFLAGHRKDLRAPDELVASILDKFILANADRVIPHCLALLPDDARPHLETCIERLDSSDSGEDLEIYLDPGPAEEARAWLKERRRAVAEAVSDYLRRFSNPGGCTADLVVPTVDLFWERLRGIRLDEHSTCQAAGCQSPTLWVSAFCARHHFEHVEGKPPPDY